MDAKDIALIKALGGGGSGGSGGSIMVDSALSDTSTNPVQNKVIKSALDALGVQSDWNQNDDTQPDYVKNRPCYTKMDTVLEYGVLDGFEAYDSGMYQCVLPYALDIADGAKVEVSWDNQVYQLTATQSEDGTVFFGNSIFWGGENSGEPFAFMIVKVESITYVGSTSTETSHEIGIVVESPVRIKPYFLPSNIVYLQNGLIPLDLVIPTEQAIFGGPIATSVVYSTPQNPYPNKLTLNNLTLETFNAMLDGTIFVPKNIMIENDIAYVDIKKIDREIRVSWNQCGLYASIGYDVGGAKIIAFNAKIHEDANNSGTIVSEYAAVLVADKRLT